MSGDGVRYIVKNRKKEMNTEMGKLRVGGCSSLLSSVRACRIDAVFKSVDKLKCVGCRGQSVKAGGPSSSSPHRARRSRNAALTRRRRRHGTNARHAGRRPGHSAGCPGPTSTASAVSRGRARRAPSSSIATERAYCVSKVSISICDSFHAALVETY